MTSTPQPANSSNGAFRWVADILDARRSDRDRMRSEAVRLADVDEQTLKLTKAKIESDMLIAEFNALRQEILHISREQDTLFRLMIVISAGVIPIFIQISIVNTDRSSAVALLEVASLMLSILSWPVAERVVTISWIASYIENILKERGKSLLKSVGPEIGLSVVFDWEEYHLIWYRERQKFSAQFGRIAYVLSVLASFVWHMAYFLPAISAIFASIYFRSSYGIPWTLESILLLFLSSGITLVAAVALPFWLVKQDGLHRMDLSVSSE